MAFPKELMIVVRDTMREVMLRLPMSSEEQVARMGCSYSERFSILYRTEMVVSEERARDICVALGINWDDVVAVSKQRWQHNEEYTKAVNNIAKACTRD